MSFPAIFNVDNLDGKNGFMLTSSRLHFGYAVAGTGDINGDGKPDLIVGAHSTSKAYVVFGADNFTATLDTTSLNGSNGFTITSVSSNTFFEIQIAGTGDVNGDGKQDIIVGAPEANKAYLIFGANSFPAVFDTSSLNGANGFTLVSPGIMFGRSVAGTGDVNGDGKSDLIVGDTTEAYVIFGGSSFPALFNTSNLNGINGFKIISSSLDFGSSVAWTADINGDRKSDLIVGAPWANQTVVIFGANTFPAIFNTANLNGANGFTLTSTSMFFGYSVAGAGDINGDSKSDLIVGTNVGNKACVVFGASAFPAIFDTSSLNGVNGFTLTSSGGHIGVSVAGTGDLNADGKSDLIIGDESSGKAHIIFGASAFSAIFNTANLNGVNGFTLTSSGLSFGVSVAGLGDINGDGRPDLMVGAYGSNKAYVIFGPTMYQNYGMLSQIKYFIPMNQTDTTGKMNIGSDGEWCNRDALFVGDFNGDGRSDLLCSMWNGQNYIMLSQLTDHGVIFTPMDRDPDGNIKIGVNDRWCLKDTQEMLIGDFNADGKSDLLCHNNQRFNQGFTYVMISTGDEFKPMADSLDGYVKVGKLGNFCPIGGRLIIGNFDGLGGDDLLCNSHTGENMIMISTNASFVSINSDILGSVTLGWGRTCKGWCANSSAVLISGDFNNDNRTDLICNDRGENQIMISTFNRAGCDFQPINPASGDQQANGWIKMGQGNPQLSIWCDSLYAKLSVADIDGDNLDDLVCNDKGAHKIQLCKYVTNDQYEFRSINKVDPSGSGSTKVASYDRWCKSQSLTTGHFSDTGLDDLWCNQANSPIGEIYDEQT